MDGAPVSLSMLHVLRPARGLFPLFLPQDAVNALSYLLGLLYLGFEGEIPLVEFFPLGGQLVVFRFPCLCRDCGLAVHHAFEVVPRRRELDALRVRQRLFPLVLEVNLRLPDVLFQRVHAPLDGLQFIPYIHLLAYHEYTDYVITHSLMNGNDLGLFDPDGAVTRAAVVMTLWNYENRPVANYAMQFTDVKEGRWYTEAIRWAASEGIVDGYANGTFQPDKPVNREELAKILYGYEKKYGNGGFKGAWMFPLTFADSAKVGGWAYEAVAWCSMNGVITGKPGSIFDPAGNAKRSDLAAMLTRYFTLER